MLIWKLSDWRVESDGYICGQHLAELGELRALRQANMQLVAKETTRLAERARHVKRRAIARGYAAGRAAALHDLVMPATACVFALAHLKEDLVRIAMKAVSELIDELPPHAILSSQLRHSLQATPGQNLLSIRVAARDLDEARRVIGSIEAELGLSLVTVLADANLPPRSCIVETDGGVIDGGLRHQLAALERGMHAAVAAVLNEYTRMDDTLLRQLDCVALGLRDTLDVLARDAALPASASKSKRTVKRKSRSRLAATPASDGATA